MVTTAIITFGSGNRVWNLFKRNGHGFAVVLGAVLVQLTLGTVFTIGNMSPYVTSYLRLHGDPQITNHHNVWIDAIVIVAEGLVMPFGGIVDRRLGPRITGLIGCAIMSCGTALTYFTVGRTYVMVLATYAAIFGIGNGVAYIAMVAVGIRWFPNNRGVVNGVILGAFSFGSFAFSIVQTAFLNPTNVSPGKDGYFTDGDVLDRLPRMFLVLAAIYAVIQLIGCSLLRNPSTDATLPQMDGDDQLSVCPSRALRTKEFYIFWTTMLLNVQSVTYFNSMYKTFGQTFIEDDHFLALVGAMCAIANTVGRIAWGFFIDRFKYKKCMIWLCVYVIVFMMTIQLTKDWGKAMFAVWSIFLFFGLAGTYTLICTGVSRTFGPKHAGTLYGMVFAQAVIGGPITAVATQYLSPTIGFTGMFYLLSGFSFLSMIITALFKDRSVAVELNGDTPLKG